jgi:hypothetical protein
LAGRMPAKKDWEILFLESHFVSSPCETSFAASGA